MATPENLLYAAVHGTAWRFAVERRPLESSIRELRALAAGRDDVLAEAAGITVGAWFAWPQVHVGHELVVAGMLILAAERLDHELLAHWARVGHERALQDRRPVHGDPLPRLHRHELPAPPVTGARSP